ncbi:hypothetical protein LPB136_08030 [Tenacibaculum todarodis]|uniref:Uncharacterized protein n=1 Tax=Tenacibaculum todarodis TaxID=1850252 RepID=A0A1L3JJH9_9FLAO|nr:DUF3857 domain-containing protein [Tenacibaculum todarodis]APG65300.1 hypothetical protein LPB136_08030 [Tenacibaculum todarodis]
MKKLLFILITIASINCFSQEIEFGKVSKIELEEKFYPLDSTTDAAYLYRGRKTYYDFNQQEGSFNVTTEVHNRIKIYNKEGFDKATQNIYYYKPSSNKDTEKVTSIKAYTFNLGEKKQKLSSRDIFDKEENKYWSLKKLTMPNIKEGCIIDIKYKIISPFYNKIDDLDFQFEIPVKNLDYSLLIPEYFLFNNIPKGYYYIKPKIERKSNFIEINTKNRSGWNTSKTTYNYSKIDYVSLSSKYNAKNIPALKDNETFVSNISNYRGGVKFELREINFFKLGGSINTYSTSWENVSKKIYQSSSFGSELNKTNYFKNDLQNLIKTNSSNLEKTIAIFQFVKSKVKWNGYNGKYTDVGVKKAYKEGVGNVADINLILTSMLREAGLNASPVLVSTRKNGVPLFPTLEGFNYVIALVEFPNNTYTLLDATEPYSSPNILPTRALNWNGRKVTREGKSSWIKLTSNKLAEEENTVTIKIASDTSGSGFLRSKLDNLNALNFRKSYSHIKNEELINKLEEKYNIEIENYRLSNKKNISKPINQMSKFSSEDLVERINGKLYVHPLLFLTQTENPFKAESRKFPVDFTSPWKEINKTSIEIPEGYKIETTPDNLAIGLPDNLGFFKFQTTTTEKKIKVLSHIQFNSAIISPQYYPILKEFYSKVVAKQLEKIVLSK